MEALTPYLIIGTRYVSSDGSPVSDEGCRHHARRAGDFASGSEEIRSAMRKKSRPPGIAIGFRVAREL